MHRHDEEDPRSEMEDAGRGYDVPEAYELADDEKGPFDE